MRYDGTPGKAIYMRTEEMEAPRRFSFTWPLDEDLPFEDAHADGRTTKVTFELEPDGDATVLRLVEIGFESLPEGTRLPHFRRNQKGWAAQMEKLTAHVA